MKAKPVYSIDAPDQRKLKVARAEIEAVMKKHDLAGAVVLHTPGMLETFWEITPSYSCCWVDVEQQAFRMRAKLADYKDAAAHRHDVNASTNLVFGLAEELFHLCKMFVSMRDQMRVTLDVDEKPAVFVDDAAERNKH